MTAYSITDRLERLSYAPRDAHLARQVRDLAAEVAELEREVARLLKLETQATRAGWRWVADLGKWVAPPQAMG